MEMEIVRRRKDFQVHFIVFCHLAAGFPSVCGRSRSQRKEAPTSWHPADSTTPGGSDRLRRLAARTRNRLNHQSTFKAVGLESKLTPMVRLRLERQVRQKYRLAPFP